MGQRWQLGVSLKILLSLCVLSIVVAMLGTTRRNRPTVDTAGDPGPATAIWTQHALMTGQEAVVDLRQVDSVELLRLTSEEIFGTDEPIDMHSNEAPAPLAEGSIEAMMAGSPAEIERLNQRRRYLRTQHPELLFPTDNRVGYQYVIGARRLLQGTEAQTLLKLWRSQTMDCDISKVAGCHDPDYALRLRAGQRPLLEISLCWECKNARFTAGNNSTYCFFHADTPKAQQLHTAFKRYFPDARRK